MKARVHSGIFLLLAMFILSACGGGGGSSSSPPAGGDGGLNDNSSPSAVLKSDKTAVSVGTTITFDGSESTDPDDDILKYDWSIEPDSAGFLSDSESSTIAFTPQESGDFTVTLLVSDDHLQDSAQIDIKVSEPNNPQPIAAISASKTSVVIGESVLLDGSGSSDPDNDPLEFSWSVTPETGYNLPFPSDMESEFTPQQAGEFVITLMVVDDRSAQDTTEIIVTATAPEDTSPPGINTAPTAAISASSLSVPVGTPVMLNGSNSSDPENDPLEFTWSVVPDSGSFTDAQAEAPVFTPLAQGVFTITLSVHDGQATDEASLAITAVSSIDTNFSSRIIPAIEGTQIRSLAGTSNGNIIALGRIETSGDQDAQLTALKPNGEVSFQLAFGDAEDQTPKKVVVTSENTYKVFGETGPSSGDRNIFIASIEGEAATDFRTLNIGGDDTLNYAKASANGYLLAGNTASDANTTKMFFAEVNGDGDLLWHHVVGDAGTSNSGLAIIQTAQGYFVTGTSRSGTAQSADIYFAQIDPTQTPAAILWSRLYGGTGEDFALGLEETTDGFALVGSSNSGSGDGYQVFIVKTDRSGNPEFDPEGLKGRLLLQEIDNAFPMDWVKLAPDELAITGADLDNSDALGYNIMLLKVNFNEPDLVEWHQSFDEVEKDDIGLFLSPTAKGYFLAGLTNATMEFETPLNFGLTGAYFWLAETTAQGNVAPSSLPIEDQTRSEGAVFIIEASGFFKDIGGDPLTYSATGYPDGWVMNSQIGRFGGLVPAASSVATNPLTITITASDGELEAHETFTLTIE